MLMLADTKSGKKSLYHRLNAGLVRKLVSRARCLVDLITCTNAIDNTFTHSQQKYGLKKRAGLGKMSR